MTLVLTAAVMDRSGSMHTPQKQQHQIQGPLGSEEFRPMPYSQYGGYWWYAPQPHHMQPHSGYMPQHQLPPGHFPPPGVRPFALPGYIEGGPPQVYAPPPPAYVDPATGAVHAAPPIRPGMEPHFPQRPGMPRPQPPGMMHPGFMPAPMPMALGQQQQQQQQQQSQTGERRVERPKFLIPGNGVRSNSTSSIKRMSSNSVRSLSEDLTDRGAAAAAAPASVPPPPAPAAAAPPQPPADVSNAQAPCAFFLKTGTCAYGDRCKFQHESPALSLNMLNSLGLPLRPGQPECQFYQKHLRCGFGASCKYHHPEPASHQRQPWQMPPGSYPMYPHMVMPLPHMVPPPQQQQQQQQVIRAFPPASGLADLSASVSAAGTSVRTESSSSSVLVHDEQGSYQGSARWRSRLSAGRGGGRLSDAGAPAAGALPPPPPAALPPAEELIQHEAVAASSGLADLPDEAPVLPVPSSQPAAVGEAVPVDLVPAPTEAPLPTSPAPAAAQSPDPEQLQLPQVASPAPAAEPVEAVVPTTAAVCVTAPQQSSAADVPPPPAPPAAIKPAAVAAGAMHPTPAAAAGTGGTASRVRGSKSRKARAAQAAAAAAAAAAASSKSSGQPAAESTATTTPSEAMQLLKLLQVDAPADDGSDSDDGSFTSAASHHDQ